MFAKYCMVLPKRANDSLNTDNISKLNDESSIYRIRKELNPIKLKKKPQRKNILPSSYLPDFFFTNTVSHPYLIFFNLNLKFTETKDGLKFPNDGQFNNETIVDQLTSYFGIDVLSIAQLKVDQAQVSDTWNRRFPFSKSNLFSPIQEGLKVTDVSDIKSLHLLGFCLNISIFLIFPIGDNYLYNMKLGPDVSDNDVHFKVLYNVDKSKLFAKKRGSNDKDIFKQEKWLTFKLIEIGDISDLKLNIAPFGTNKDVKQNILFLEMEKRDPIPIILFPEFGETTEFKKINLQMKELLNGIPNMSISNNDEDTITIDVLISNPKEKTSMNKIKSIATTLNSDQSSNQNANNSHNKNNNENIIIAETNESAFFVTENINTMEQKNEDNDKQYKFKFGQPFAQEDIKNSIISFNDRLKKQYTFSELISEDGKSNHPLMNLLCLYNLTSIMITSTQIIDEKLHIKRNENELGSKLRIMPIENDDEIYYSYEKVNKDAEKWKKITKMYPAFLSMGQNHSYDKDYGLTRKYNNEDDKLFQDFYFYVKTMSFALFDEVLKINITSKQTIDYFMKSHIGMNPIFCPVIYKEYIELSRSDCILYYSNQKYDNPLNTLLMRDVQSVNEVMSRTTINYFDKDAVVKNVELGIFPVKIQALLKKIEMKKNQRIPDPSFSFIPTHNIINDIKNELEIKTRKPKYSYNFYGVEDGKIIKTSKFTINSQYKICFLYVSQDNVFSVAQINSKKFAFGFCKTLDTEMAFSEPHFGSFKSAIYMETDKCLIINYSYKRRIYFTGYDEQGQINEIELNPDDFPSQIESLAVISRSYFAAQIDSDNKKKKVCVFKYNSQKRIVEKSNYSDSWRTKEKILCINYLKKKATNPKCFIGNRLSSAKEFSTLCIFEFDESKREFIANSENYNKSNENEIISMNFVLDQEKENGYIYDDDIKMLENRINERNKKEEEEEETKKKIHKNLIVSMLNCVPIDKEKKSFSVFDIQCCLCELYPTPIVINNKLVIYSNNNNISFYLCDPNVYRLISHQIQAFYINTIERMSLFTTELLLKKYKFTSIKVALIIDTSGIGPRLSNLIFGTRFEERQIIDDEIWCGFSYSNEIAYIILLFHVKDVVNVFNAIETKKERNKSDFKNSLIFMCQNDGVKNYIKFGCEPIIITTPASSNAGNVKNHISFINNAEFENQIPNLYDDVFENVENVFDDADDAIDFAKGIITQYLSFNIFDHYPIKTIQTYSDFLPPNQKNIKIDLSYS